MKKSFIVHVCNFLFIYKVYINQLHKKTEEKILENFLDGVDFKSTVVHNYFNAATHRAATQSVYFSFKGITMKTTIDSIVRTPGVLFMAILMMGFIVNAGVEYLHATHFEGPNLMAAACLAVAQVVLVVVHQVRRIQASKTVRLMA